jgi:hypothetical protein
MRTVILAGALALLVPTSMSAAPIACPIDSLADYTGLSPDGCFIGSAVLKDFAVSAGATIDPASVLVTPIDAPSVFGLQFDVNEAAGPNDLLSLLLRYTVTQALVTANRLTMTGAAATGDGVVTAVEDKCLGAPFAGDHPSSGCANQLTHIALVSEFDTIVPDPASFPVESFFDVFTEIVVDGGPAGSAELRGAVTNEFSTRAASEPVTLLLLGPGAAALVRRRRRC